MISIPDGLHHLEHRTAAFGAQLYGLKFQEGYGHPLGQKLDNIENLCIPASLFWEDYFDNDCDGFYDEEIENGIDDDGDGLIDEDVFNNRTRRFMQIEQNTRQIVYEAKGGLPLETGTQSGAQSGNIAPTSGISDDVEDTTPIATSGEASTKATETSTNNVLAPNVPQAITTDHDLVTIKEQQAVTYEVSTQVKGTSFIIDIHYVTHYYTLMDSMACMQSRTPDFDSGFRVV